MVIQHDASFGNHCLFVIVLCDTALRIIFLRQRRLIRVQDYLQNSAFNIDKIAELTGFSHSALLRHHFHQLFLLSPSQYRKNNRPPSH